MRKLSVGVVAGALAVTALSVAPPAESGTRCAGALPPGPIGLPARLLLRTSCGTYGLDPDGTVRPAPPLPPAPSSWQIGNRNGHVVLLENGRTVWRSRRAFRRALGDFYSLAVGDRDIAFSFFKGPLWIARFGEAEHSLGRYEAAEGWTATHELLTAHWSRTRPGILFVRREDGSGRRLVASDVIRALFDDATKTILYMTGTGVLVRSEGDRASQLADLRSYGLGAKASWWLIGEGLISFQENGRLVILRADGSLFASSELVVGSARDGPFTSWIVPGTDAVAFTVVKVGDNPSTTVYVLRAGESQATAVYRADGFAPGCDTGWDTLSWHDDWLLYADAGGYAVVIDSTDPARRIDLSSLVSRLPGVDPNRDAATGPVLSGFYGADWVS